MSSVYSLRCTFSATNVTVSYVTNRNTDLSSKFPIPTLIPLSFIQKINLIGNSLCMIASSRIDIFLQQKQFISLVPEQKDIEEVSHLSLRPLNLSMCSSKHVKFFK